jgi:surfactin synthase thioesterase subunit
MPEPWFFHPLPRPAAAIQLICFPHAGGGASAFRTWPEPLGPDIDLLAVRLPGRESRFAAPRYRRMTDLVTDLCAALHDRLRPPYAFFGHSLGALVAYETACRLAGTGGVEPVRLVAAASAAPHRRYRYGALHDLPDAELIDTLCEFGGMPAEVLDDHELLCALLPMIRDDFEIADTYRPAASGRLHCPVTALGGARDRSVDAADIAAWPQVTVGAGEVVTVPGDHFFVHQPESGTIRIVKDAVAVDPALGPSR